MAADFVLLADDPVTARPEKISEVEVLATVVGGRVSHDQAGVLAEAGLLPAGGQAHA
jgi:hypothetical protein